MKKKSSDKIHTVKSKPQKKKPYFFGKIQLKKLNPGPDLYTVYAGPADCGPYGAITGCEPGTHED